MSDATEAVVAGLQDVFWRDESTVSDYLGTSRQAIPLANEQFDSMLRVIAAFGGPTTSVLDLGAGDGAAAEVIARAFPVESVTLVDFSLPMLNQAISRFAGSSLAVDVIDADLHETTWQLQLPGEIDAYDIVVSRYAIHHLPDERKRELYAEIFDRLRPGGIFANIEHVSSASPVFTEIFDGLIIEGMVATSNPPLDRGRASAAYHGRYDAEINILAPADLQCGWLRDTGFVDVDVVMKLFELAVIVARKPDS